MTRRKSTRKKWLMALATVVFASILTASFLMYRAQPSPPTPPKKTLDQYFSFSVPWADVINVSSRIVKITTLYFNITATGGDAHHLAIFPPGMADFEDYYKHDEATNGTSLAIEIAFPNPVLSTKDEQGFPIKLRMYCDEAEGNVTLYIPESNIFA